MSIDNLTVIIPFRNGNSTIERLLNSLPSDLPVIVVDDMSVTPFETTRGNVKVIRQETRGYFAGACNTGIANCDTDVLILNQDVWMQGTDWIELLKKRGDFEIGGDGVFGHPAHSPHGYCQGTFLWLTRKLIAALGTVFDAEFFPLWGCTALTQTRACRLGFKALPVHASDYGMRHERGDKPYGSSIAATLKNEPAKQSLFVRTPPLVSVVITCYNYGRYLQDAVNSLIGGKTSLGAVKPQTFQAFEVVIVDDASRDDTAKLGEALADPWRGIRFIRRNVNGGSAAAVNTGIEAAFGKWVAVMDGDDMMEPQRLELLYRLAEQNPHRFIYDDLNYFARGRKYFVHNLPDYDFDVTLHKNKIHKGLLLEKRAWAEVGGYPAEMKQGREDWAMNIRLGAHGYCGIHHAEPLYLYRREGQNRSLTNTDSVEWRARFVAQLHALYPALYAGERTKMCCGKSSKTVKTPHTNGNGHSMGLLGIAPIGGMMIGQEGMTLLNYLPQKLGGGQQYVGPVTKQVYVFGGKRTSGFVDNRDVDKFLELREGGKLVFARGQVEQPVVANILTTLTAKETDWSGGMGGAGEFFRGLGDLIPANATEGDTPLVTTLDNPVGVLEIPLTISDAEGGVEEMKIPLEMFTAEPTTPITPTKPKTPRKPAKSKPKAK